MDAGDGVEVEAGDGVEVKWGWGRLVRTAAGPPAWRAELLFCRYNVEEEGGCEDMDQGDNGWKIIHTDVFRFPPYKSLLCAVLGVGAQFLTLATS